MRVAIRLITMIGANVHAQTVVEVNVNPNEDTVLALSCVVQSPTFFFYRGQILRKSRKLSFYRIQENDIIVGIEKTNKPPQKQQQQQQGKTENMIQMNSINCGNNGLNFCNDVDDECCCDGYQSNLLMDEYIDQNEFRMFKEKLREQERQNALRLRDLFMMSAEKKRSYSRKISQFVAEQSQTEEKIGALEESFSKLDSRSICPSTGALPVCW